MLLETTFIHSDCPFYFAEYYIGFRSVLPKKGDHYIGKKYDYNTLVFLLKGEIEFSYNEYLNRRFRAGDLFFIPQDSEMYGVALTDAHMLVLTYDFIPDSHCASRALSKVKHEKDVLKGIHYDFRPLAMTPPIMQFAELMSSYIARDYRCQFLHELKQKELLVIMHYEYTPNQLKELFYPMIGEDMNFRARILKLAHEQLSVRELAERFNMGDRSFMRKFKSEFGQTVHQWMLQHKASQIKLRLLRPDTSIPALVDEFKFPDIPHFHRFCREQFGCTVKEFIAKMKVQNAD